MEGTIILTFFNVSFINKQKNNEIVDENDIYKNKNKVQVQDFLNFYSPKLINMHIK
jgi:uncharacterized membrane protein YukC